MSNSKFHERFKYKSSTITTTGEIAIDRNKAIIKAEDVKLHASVIQGSENYSEKSNLPQLEPREKSSILKHHFDSITAKSESSHVQSLPLDSVSPNLKKKSQNHSAAPITKVGLSLNPNIKELNKSYDKKNKDFVPYTIKDYYSIKPKTYYQLGGLGPSNIGTNDWILKKKANDKRITYGRKIYYLNAVKLPLLPTAPPHEEKSEANNCRNRGLNFAKTISKPPLRVSLSPIQ